MKDRNDKLVFWGCFIALITTAFAFVTRTFMVNMDGLWPATFGLNKVQGQPFRIREIVSKINDILT